MMIVKKVQCDADYKKGLAGVIKRMNYILKQKTPAGLVKCDFSFSSGFCYANCSKGYARELWGLTLLSKCFSNPYLHYVMSWREGEWPGEAEVKEIVEKFIQSMGLANCQYVVAQHVNTENRHVHIFMSRVDRASLVIKRINNGFDNRLAEESVLSIANEYGWGGSDFTNRKKRAAEVLGVAAFNDMQSRIEKASNWRDLFKSIYEVGADFFRTLNGGVFLVQGNYFCASDFGGECSFPWLEKRFGKLIAFIKELDNYGRKKYGRRGTSTQSNGITEQGDQYIEAEMQSPMQERMRRLSERNMAWRCQKETGSELIRILPPLSLPCVVARYPDLRWLRKIEKGYKLRDVGAPCLVRHGTKKRTSRYQSARRKSGLSTKEPTRELHATGVVVGDLPALDGIFRIEDPNGRVYLFRYDSTGTRFKRASVVVMNGEVKLLGRDDEDYDLFVVVISAVFNEGGYVLNNVEGETHMMLDPRLKKNRASLSSTPSDIADRGASEYAFGHPEY